MWSSKSIFFPKMRRVDFITQSFSPPHMVNGWINDEDEVAHDIVVQLVENEISTEDVAVLSDPTESKSLHVVPRRCARVVSASKWSFDYVFHFSTVNYENLTEKYISLVAAISKIHEPLTFQETIVNPHWMEAMREEIQVLQNNNTWEIID